MPYIRNINSNKNIKKHIISVIVNIYLYLYYISRSDCKINSKIDIHINILITIEIIFPINDEFGEYIIIFIRSLVLFVIDLLLSYFKYFSMRIFSFTLHFACLIDNNLYILFFIVSFT